MSIEHWLLHSLDGVARGHAVDVGANVGSWTRFLAGEFAMVTAVEPDGRAYGQLASDLPKNAIALRRAVCDHTGEVTLYTRLSSEQSSLLESHPIGGVECVAVPPAGKEKVRGVTLDELCPRGCDYIKIDIEGAEVLALEAATASVWAQATFLVECHDTFDQVCESLHRLGKVVERVAHPLPGAHVGHCWAIGRNPANGVA